VRATARSRANQAQAALARRWPRACRREPFDGHYSARRGTYRVTCRIDEAKHQIEIHSIRHRRDAYRI
jgi:mRNA-degrading endonuclease RelE of RelBE toxin-antitoxin system